MSSELTEQVETILKKSRLPDRSTFFQIEKFMIGKEPTGQSQLWAIIRELDARNETIKTFKKDLADAEDNLELYDIRIERLNRLIKEEAEKEELFTDLNIQEHEINIRKIQREKESLIRSAQTINHKFKCVMEEMAFLVSGYHKIVAKIGECKPLDDDQSQKEMWNEKLLEEFKLRVILQRPLDPEFIRTVMCLHDEAPVKKHIVELIDGIQKKMIEHKQVNKPSIEAKTTGR